jgi:nicotinate-nucleotide adenylyltransferase
MSTARRIGLLGGAFNPPHAAHLRLADLAFTALGLDEVRFIPTARSPHKPQVEAIPDATRLRLLRLALEGANPAFTVDTVELDRGGTSYTAETLEALRDQEPQAAFILLLGSDQLPGLPKWHRADRVRELASAAVSPRPGFPMSAPADWHLSERWSGRPGEFLALPPTDLPLASTELRAALARGEAPDGLPAQVLAAIRREALYV